jgi:exodeoxyribonuclease VII large subunit
MVQRVLAKLPPKLAVAGEISNCTRSPNGHIYFTLKDEAACVDCVMWRSDAARLKFNPTDGLAVVAVGRIDLYAPRGRYQLYVSRLLPAGRGELELAFRQLYEELSKLGWFQADRKRPIPRVPRTIGLVTSRTGAAIRDILRTLSIRWPIARVIVADARVQGEGSAESVAAAIGRVNRCADALGGIDVLIVARGGGSLEDLWSFNTEIVARAILDSRIPVVAGIGHEVDTTIADLVADLRAATPTAAAQAVVPDQLEILAQLASASSLLCGAVQRKVAQSSQQVDELSARLSSQLHEQFSQFARVLGDLGGRLAAQHPRARLAHQLRRIESLAGRMRWALGQISSRLDRALSELAWRLRQHRPSVLAQQARERLAGVKNRLGQSADRLVAVRSQRLDVLGRQLAAFDPRAVLRRGYSMTTIQSTGELLTAADQVRAGERLISELAAGRIESDVVAGDCPPRRRTRRHSSSDQPTLFCDGASDGQEDKG